MIDQNKSVKLVRDIIAEDRLFERYRLLAEQIALANESGKKGKAVDPVVIRASLKMAEGMTDIFQYCAEVAKKKNEGIDLMIPLAANYIADFFSLSYMALGGAVGVKENAMAAHVGAFVSVLLKNLMESPSGEAGKDFMEVQDAHPTSMAIAISEAMRVFCENLIVNAGNHDIDIPKDEIEDILDTNNKRKVRAGVVEVGSADEVMEFIRRIEEGEDPEDVKADMDARREAKGKTLN